MNPRVRVLIGKEWSELRRQPTLVWTTLLVPIVLVATGPLIAVLGPALAGQDAYDDPQLEPVLAALRANVEELRTLTKKELFEVFTLRQFMAILLVIPVMVGISIASYSVVGEKVNRSLEPLLATPITTGELLWAKSLAAAIPAVVVAWIAFAVYVALVAALTSPTVTWLVANFAALCIVLVVTPAVAVLGLSTGIIASSRFSDPRTAQQFGAIVVVPLVAMVLLQMRGLFLLTVPIVLAVGAVVAAIDAGVLWVGARLFRRETILTRWK